MKKQRRPQAQKNPARVKHVQELRRSNAAGIHKAKNTYTRKPRNGNWVEWE